jgi:hypothetical protein
MEGSMTDTDPRARRRYRVAFAATAMLLVGIAVTLPFSLASVLDEILGLTTGKVLPLLRPEGTTLAPAHSRLHLAVTQIDEVHLVATLRLSGHRTCGAGCPWRDRLLFVSAAPGDVDAEGLPPSASVTLPETTDAVTETFQLPLSGVPIRYPFDRYHLVVAVALQRVHPDGRVEHVGAGQSARHLVLTIQELLPHLRMSVPAAVTPGALQMAGAPVVYAAAYDLSFERPRYLRVLAVPLVLSIAAAAAYSVFLRPLQDIVVSSGALVLGVWGVRAVIVPITLHFQTAVDLALSIVILFLLGGISVKALILVHDRGGLRVLRRSGRTPRDEAEP